MWKSIVEEIALEDTYGDCTLEKKPIFPAD